MLYFEKGVLLLILEIIIDICSILANLAIFLTLFYSIKTYKQEKRQAIVNSDWQIKEATITFTNEILEKTDNLLSQIYDKFGDNTINITDMQQEENAKLYTVIIPYLTLMERLSVGLNTKVYDLDIYARICCRKTIKAWDQLENIVKDRREKIKNDNLYIEFERVVSDLREWRSGTPEKRGDHTGM